MKILTTIYDIMRIISVLKSVINLDFFLILQRYSDRQTKIRSYLEAVVILKYVLGKRIGTFNNEQSDRTTLHTETAD